MIGGVQNIGKITELRQRILFTFAMLAVYRLGVFIVTPGINAEVIKSFFEQMAGTMFGLSSMFSGGALENGSFGEGAVINPGWGFRLMCMVTLTTGTAFIMWLGEQITERGIGNGISMIIFTSIIVAIPSGLGQLVQLIRTD
jgi:preprotein translocase subunit SecY